MVNILIISYVESGKCSIDVTLCIFLLFYHIQFNIIFSLQNNFYHGVNGYQFLILSSLILRRKTDSWFTTYAVNESETMIVLLLSTGYGAKTSTLVMTASSAKEILWDEKLHRR